MKNLQYLNPTLRHRCEFIAYLASKNSFSYPSPLYGKRISKQQVINSWKKTMRLVRLGKVSSRFFVYVHIPYCKCSCLYCMSRSLKLADEKQAIPKYLKLLYEEMDAFSPVVGDQEIATIYLGGGTPSLLTTAQIKDLFHNIRRRFFLSKCSRIIFEASPFTLNNEKLDTLKECGIHELDLGVQSFDQKVLNRNDRPQKVAQTVAVIKYAKRIGIPAVSIDLMVGLPYQSPESALTSAFEAAQMPVDGIYINAFKHLGWTRYCREGNTYTAAQIDSRNKTRDSIDALLVKMRFKRTVRGYWRFWTEEDREKAYLTQEANNLLGLGDGAFSHAVASLKYHELWSKSRSQYTGLPMSMDREMHVFAYTHLQDLCLDRFKKRFRKDFMSAFGKQMKILVSSGLAAVHNGKVTLLNEDPYMRRFIKSFFIDSDYVKKLEKISEEKYDAHKDYRSITTPFTA